MAKNKKLSPGEERELNIKNSIIEFEKSEKTAEDYEKMLVTFMSATRPGVCPPWPHVQRAISEAIEQRG